MKKIIITLLIAVFSTSIYSQNLETEDYKVYNENAELNLDFELLKSMEDEKLYELANKATAQVIFEVFNDGSNMVTINVTLGNETQTKVAFDVKLIYYKKLSSYEVRTEDFKTVFLRWSDLDIGKKVLHLPTVEFRKEKLNANDK